jgi:serine-type D-Ala-D-Ala carboxypeptidase/endopeptidase (penicillin-binding protein 4)
MVVAGASVGGTTWPNTRVLQMHQSNPYAQYFLGLLVVLCCSVAAGAQPPLNARVQALIGASGCRNAQVGVYAVEVQNGQILCALDEARPLIPASNMKLLTTGVALFLLGEDFRFTTSVFGIGDLVDGAVLKGDLVVVAGGDPSISGRRYEGKTTAVFDAWAEAIARKVRRVRGNLVIDDTIFDREYVHPNWPQDQLVRWYCAPISALALNDNCIDVAVAPGPRPGTPARVILDPATEYFQVVNHCKTVAAKAKQAIIHRTAGRDQLVISGTLAPDSPGSASPVAVADPTRFAATVLRERLAAAGVVVEGKIVLADQRVNVEKGLLLARTSHPLLDAVAVANKRSQNFYAEMIFKTLGRTVADPSTFKDGATVMVDTLSRIGLKKQLFTVDDGSGMSRGNTIAPGQMVLFLRAMALGPRAEAFIGSLAISGEDGTLQRRMRDAAMKGKVLAKTGYLRGVSALSGYVKSGDKIAAFSILVNGPRIGDARTLQDRICRLILDALE